MSPHPFRFAPLLDWAEQREEHQIVALAAALRAEEAAFETLQMLVEEREGQIALLEARVGRIDPAERQTAALYVQHLQRQVEAQQAAVAEAHERTETERAVLLEITREKRSLEHLRERDEAREAEEADRREASQADDLNMARHARRLQAGGSPGGKESPAC